MMGTSAVPNWMPVQTHARKAICTIYAKLTMSIALAVPTKKDGLAAITKSAMTSTFCKLEQSEKSDVLQKLCYRIPIVQAVIKSDDWRSALDWKS